MTTQYAKSRDEFIAICARNKISRETARTFMRLATTHGRIAVDVCNGPGDYVNRIPYPRAGEIYREHEERCAKREARIESRLQKLAEANNLKIRLGGDPRGFTVSIFMPDNSYNSWGGAESGYGVPQRD